MSQSRGRLVLHNLHVLCFQYCTDSSNIFMPCRPCTLTLGHHQEGPKSKKREPGCQLHSVKQCASEYLFYSATCCKVCFCGLLLSSDIPDLCYGNRALCSLESHLRLIRFYICNSLAAKLTQVPDSTCLMHQAAAMHRH